MADNGTVKGTGGLINSTIGTTAGYGKQPYLDLISRDPDELHEEALTVHGIGTMEAPSDNPTAEEFLSWHLLEQLDLIPDIELNADGTIKSGVTVIGEDPDTITVVKSVDGDQIYVIDYLQKRDILAMTADDQAVVTQTSIWLNQVSVALNMVPSTLESLAEASADLLTAIDGLATQFDNPGLTYDDGSYDSTPFVGRLEILRSQIESDRSCRRPRSTQSSRTSRTTGRATRPIAIFRRIYP